jgi:hypothetical protein
MANGALKSIPVPPAAESFLADARDALRLRKIERLRLYPLILRQPLDRLIARRRRLYDSVDIRQTHAGYEVAFNRQLKRSKTHPDGRLCTGTFSLLIINEQLVVVASSLTGDDHLNGPDRWVKNAYPLARRPFFPSNSLIQRIEAFAASRAWEPISVDAIGYHRHSQRLRRDMDPQPPAEVAREMAEQGRRVHKLLVSYRHNAVETARIKFDRNCTATIEKGSPATALRELILPGVSEALQGGEAYEVERAEEPAEQESVELEFQDEPFDSYDSMRSLCDAVRHADGLNVSIIHLNPYLQAQILDFFTGAAIEMLVTDTRVVSLIPRSSGCGAAMERVATTIYRYFGEAKPKRTRVSEFL